MKILSSLIVATAIANMEVEQPTRAEKLCNQVQEDTITRIEHLKGFVKEEDKILHNCLDGFMFMYEPDIPNIFMISND